jgi:hypothetical protein
MFKRLYMFLGINISNDIYMLLKRFKMINISYAIIIIDKRIVCDYVCMYLQNVLGGIENDMTYIYASINFL